MSTCTKGELNDLCRIINTFKLRYRIYFQELFYENYHLSVCQQLDGCRFNVTFTSKKCSLLMEINVFCCHEPYTHTTHKQQRTGGTHRMGAPSRGRSRYSEKSASACVLPSLHSRSFEMNVWVCVGGWRDNEFPGRLRANR